jgi:hypothetical protein
MNLSVADTEHLAKLKAALQEQGQAAKFEQLVAALIGRLLNVGVAVAKTGFQHGGDAGTSGREGRHLRIECKKYADTTSLSDRELLGEVDQALNRDAGLEAWILAATRDVPEQLEQELEQHAAKLGISIVVVDWKGNGMPALAALCASAPDLVGVLFTIEAGRHAEVLQAVAADRIGRLRRELDAWAIGFEVLRFRAESRLRSIWTSPRASQAALNQNASGGATQKVIVRASVLAALDAWWAGSATGDAPAVVLGSDGVGKTFATIAWLVENVKIQPIVLVVASSGMKELAAVSEVSVKRFLATQLYEVTGGVRDPEHWMRRVEHLLKRPATEGPVFTVFHDGMNQEPSVPWIPLLKILQADPFAGRVRVIVSTRNWHFGDKLGQLRGLVVQPTLIPVDVYDDAPGGELDQRLALEGLTRGQLHADLVDLARTPRLFDLVVRFKDQLVDAGEVTSHRLLWEYGRDAHGERAGRSFSEADWRAWLSEIARRFRDGVREYSVKSLGEMAGRPDLSERELYSRLSDVIDGRMTIPGAGGVHRFRPDLVAHALGAALLAQLCERSNAGFVALEAELVTWLDPIAGFDQRAEILRAAVSILVAQGDQATDPVAGVLVTAWLQTQNLPNSHRHEMAGIATRLPDALLDAIEHSANHAQASARHWAIRALAAIPRRPGAALDRLLLRSQIWLSEVSRDVQAADRDADEGERHRAARFKERVGVDASGPFRVAGIDLRLVDRSDGMVAGTVPAILQGFPLQSAMPVFEVAAVAFAVAGRSTVWEGLKWLCLFNEVDPGQTTESLRSLSSLVGARKAEPNVNAALPARAAALLLWLTGREADEISASQTNPGIDRPWNYDRDYLEHPGRSFFALERRHAVGVLLDSSMPVLSRVQRMGDLWLDPYLQIPESFMAEVRALAPLVDVSKLDCSKHRTVEDHQFETIELAMARCGPEQLAAIVRAKLTQADVPGEARHVRAYSAPEHLILAGSDEAKAARGLRISLPESPSDEKWFAASQLLLLELQSEGGARQIEALMEADLKGILLAFTDILSPITGAEAEALVGRYSTTSLANRSNLMVLLSRAAIRESDVVWRWILSAVDEAEIELKRVSFRVLAEADGLRFGRHLLNQDWSWRADEDYWINHYGSGAIIKAASGIPFDQFAPRLAPWRLPEAARVRGEDPNEVRLAADILNKVFAAGGMAAPDPGATLTVSGAGRDNRPHLFSVDPIEDASDDSDPFAGLRRAMDAEAQQERHRRAVATAMERIQAARKAGASLYLANVAVDDLVAVARHAPEIVITWLQGAGEFTDDFRRRVGLADSAFLALCEALMRHDPERGVMLWRALKQSVTTRFIGEAGIDDMIHMAFRVPASAPVAELRQELLSLKWSNTDKDLFNLAIAAQLNGQGDWLAEAVAQDRASTFEWRRRRATVLEGFGLGNTLPQPLAWPDGPTGTTHADLTRVAARSRHLEACARHWWQRYLDAEDLETAYAAWTILLRAVDRRAWGWLQVEASASAFRIPSGEPRLRHASINRDVLKRWMAKRDKALNERFLGRRIESSVAPWA